MGVQKKRKSTFLTKKHMRHGIRIYAATSVVF